MVSLGSASFELVVDSSQFTGAFIQARATADAASQAIVAATKARTAAILSSDGAIKQVLTDEAARLTNVARGYADMAAQAKTRYAEMAVAAKTSGSAVAQATSQVGAATKTVAGSTQAAGSAWTKAASQAVAFGAGMLGAYTAATTLHAVLADVIDVTQKTEAATKSLTVSYGAAATSVKAFADRQADAAKRSQADVEAGVAGFATLNRQYGVTRTQVERLTALSLDLAAAYGVTVEKAFGDVTSAMGGNLGALDKYGISLEEAVHRTASLTTYEKEHFSELSKSTQAQVLLNLALDYSAHVTGESAKVAGTYTDAQKNLKKSTDDLALSTGKLLNPLVEASEKRFTDAANAANDYITSLTDLADAQNNLKAQGVPGFSQTAADLAVDAATARAALEAEVKRIRDARTAGRAGATGGPDFSSADPGVEIHPTPQEVQQAIGRYEDQQRQIAAVRKETRDLEAKAGIKAAEDEHDREVKRLDDQKTLLEVERDQRLKAVEANKDVALKGIEEEARAAKEAADARIAHLHVEEEAAKRSAQQRHDDEVAGIEATQQATEDATAENIHTLEIERERAARASEDKRDAAIKALDDEKTAREQIRTEEDRAEEDAIKAVTRREGDRHEATVRGFEAETKAANDSKDAQLRDLDEIGKRAEDAHRARLRHLSDEADGDKDRHDAAVGNIDDEERHAQKAHDARSRALDDENDRAQHRHDAAVRAIDDEGKVASEAHERRLRALTDEGGAAQAAHDRLIRSGEDEQRAAEVVHTRALAAIEVEADAAAEAHDRETRAIQDESDVQTATHDRVLREIADEGDAAEHVHEQVIRSLEARGRAEDDLHRRTLDDLDEEQRRRKDAIDEQLDALDALDRATQQAERAQQLAGSVQSAQRGVQKAESSGNLSEIEAANRALAAAQRAVLDDQTKNQRDATREQLQDQKSAIADEIKARADAENERDRLLKERVSAEKRAADDTLEGIKTELAARKQAEDDVLAGVKAELDARKHAEDDAYARIQDTLKARRDAADAAYALIQNEVAARKLAADDAYKITTDRLAKEQQAENDAYATGQERRATEKQRLDDELKAGQERRAQTKRDLDDQYRQGQERRAAEKRDLDDDLKRALDRIDHEKLAEDDAYRQTKDRLDRRKQAIGDQNKDELAKIAARKQAEDDAHDNAVERAQDQATQEKRAIADRRTAENLADKAKRDEIAATFEAETRDRKARYDDEETGEIPALHRALHEAQEHFRQRKQAADSAYQDEQHQIDDTYNNAETGLIPLAQKAASATAASFVAQTKAVTEEAHKQAEAIRDEYINPAKTGLLDLLERARADSQDKLDRQRQYWQDWAEDIGGPNGQIKKVIDQFNALITKIQQAGGVALPGINQQGGVGTTPYGPPVPGGAGGGGVPAPYRVTFPFDAPYNGPYPGGAAWKDGPTRHRGVDLALPGPDNGRGTPYGAFQPGVVEALIPESADPAGGNGILIRTDSGLYNYYGHNDRFLVAQGERVGVGQQIGVLGRSGLDPGMQTHLHYEVRRGANGDPVGQTIDPVPYMAGGTVGSAGGRTFEFDLFGHHFVFRLPGGRGGLELIQAIEQLGESIGGREFGRAAASIALAEGADGDLTVPGSGGARGPYQFDPGGELPAYAAYLHTSPDAAGDYAGAHPLDAAAWALKGYLGDALRDGLAQDPPLKGAELAEYGSYYGQRPAGDNWKRAGDASRELWGYGGGGPIPEPTLLVGRTLGPYAMAGETGRPEWVTNAAPGTSGAPVNQYRVPVQLGNHTIETLVFEGLNLVIRRGGVLDIRT